MMNSKNGCVFVANNGPFSKEEDDNFLRTCVWDFMCDSNREVKTVGALLRIEENKIFAVHPSLRAIDEMPLKHYIILRHAAKTIARGVELGFGSL